MLYFPRAVPVHQIFGSAGLAYATAALTVTTLFFGELLPKALGVNNAEVVARRVLPIIIVLSVVLNPVAKTFTLISSVSANAGVVSGCVPCVYSSTTHSLVLFAGCDFLCSLGEGWGGVAFNRFWLFRRLVRATIAVTILAVFVLYLLCLPRVAHPMPSIER